MGISGFPAEQHPQLWSMVSFLMQLDQTKFGDLIQLMKQRPEASDTFAWQEKAFDRVYGKTLDQIEEHWIAWVKETYPK